MRITERKSFFLKSLPFLFYCALWEAVSFFVDEPLLFPSLSKVSAAFLKLWTEAEFYVFSFNTCRKVFLGFFSAFFAGAFLGWLSFFNEWVKSLLRIPIMLMKSVPVAAYIIMLYMWLPSHKIPALIAFIAVFPVVYNNIYDSFFKRNQKLFEMADVFEVKGIKRLLYISFPEAFPFVKAAVRTGLSLSFKSAVAAEVITISANTVGASLYDAKIYFDMTALLSRTLALLLISFVFEKLFLLLLDKALERIEEGLSWI